jgi:hypothetical protein
MHREMRAVPARFGAPGGASASQWLTLASAKEPYERSYGKYCAPFGALRQLGNGEDCERRFS